MPRRRRHAANPDTSTTNGSDQERERDGQDRVGNRSFWDFLRNLGRDNDQEESVDQDQALSVEGTDQDVEIARVEEALEGSEIDLADTSSMQTGDQDAMTGILAMAAEQKAPERVRDRAEDVQDKVSLAAGSEYKVTADDLAASDPWKKIAKDHGMSPGNLVPFNQHISSVNSGVGAEAQVTQTTELADGVTIYIPSAAEILLGQCRAKTESYEAALELYGTIAEGPNVKLLETARDRASGKVGESYGTKGVEGGRFLTQNPTLAGASKKRSEEINGKTEYKVMWLKDFWKCSLYMHDVVWSAGYKPSQSSNNHYKVAGRLQEAPEFDEISAKNARPGDCWQRFGGKRSNESHNAILSSFVDIEAQGEDHEQWSFSIIGAETDRAAESDRKHTMKKGTNENTSGKKIRFFRPKHKR